jgi:hypothetical protein
MTAISTYPPLQGAIAQAESWVRYLDARQDTNGHHAKEKASALKNIVAVGIRLGELLPFTWRVIFLDLLRPSEPHWMTVREFEATRQEVRRLFFITREALERTRQAAVALHTSTGRKPAGIRRLMKTIESAAILEEAVFRDWPSFAEPLPLSEGSLTVDESLAEALGISVEEARQKLDARKHELNSSKE